MQGTDPPATKTCVYVLSDFDEYKYKLVMKNESDLRLLGTQKIKRYLAKASRVPISDQVLSFNGKILAEEVSGEVLGLFDGAVLRLHRPVTADKEAKDIAASTLLTDCYNSRSTSSRPLRCPDTTVEVPTISPRIGSSLTDAIPWMAADGSGLRTSSQGTGAAAPTVLGKHLPEDADTEFTASRRSESKLSDLCQQSKHSTTPWVTSDRENSSYTGRDSSGRLSAPHDPRLSKLETENEALQRELVFLQEKLLDAERRAAFAQSNGSTEKEVTKDEEGRRRDSAASNHMQQARLREAEARWQLKEEELVQELDLLREERRHIQTQQRAAAEEHSTELTRMRERLKTYQSQLIEKDRVLAETRALLATAQNRKSDPLGLTCRQDRPLHELVRLALDKLSQVLDTPNRLQLDEANTCVIDVSQGVTALVTLDEPSARLYMYTTLLNHIPKRGSTRLQLYEGLLEGSLLGKDIAGGAVGISKADDLVLLSITIDLRQSECGALAAAAPPFLAAAALWMRTAAALATD